MSCDPEDGKASDPKTLHKYLYAGGDPVNAMDPTGRDAVETGLTFALIDTAPLPELVEIGGGAYATAAAYAAGAYLYAMNAALDAATAFADYLAAGSYVATVTGIAKVLLCADLEVSLGTLIDKIMGEGFSDVAIPDEAVQKFREWCLGTIGGHL